MCLQTFHGVEKTPLFYYNNQHQEKRFGGSKKGIRFSKKFFETHRKPHGYWVPVISVTKDKAEPDEPRGRLALLLSLQSIWSAESSFWSVRSTRKNKKEATAQDCSCAVASLCFFIAITDFVIIYQNPARF